MQLVENKGRKTGRKLTRRMIIKCKLVEYLQVTHWDDSVLIMIAHDEVNVHCSPAK